MTRDEIVQFFARRAKSFAALDASALASSHSEDGVLESPLAGRLVGRPAIERYYQSLFTSFSDFGFEPTDLVIDGDRAVQIGMASGTNDGGFMGLPPTRKRFNYAIVLVCTLRGGLIVEQRSVYDFTGWMVQIGILKAKPQ
jgi:predicted ester cyclase